MPDLALNNYTADSSLLIPLSKQGELFVKFNLYKQPQIAFKGSLAYVIPIESTASVLIKINTLDLNLTLSELS
jgi:hypothetical protein